MFEKIIYETMDNQQASLFKQEASQTIPQGSTLIIDTLVEAPRTLNGYDIVYSLINMAKVRV